MIFPVAAILDGTQGVRKDGSAYVLSEDIDATVFVSLGQEILSVPRLSRVEISANTAALYTHKGERFYFPPDLLVGLKFSNPSAKAVRPGAGFAK